MIKSDRCNKNNYNVTVIYLSDEEDSLPGTFTDFTETFITTEYNHMKNNTHPKSAYVNIIHLLALAE